MVNTPLSKKKHASPESSKVNTGYSQYVVMCPYVAKTGFQLVSILGTRLNSPRHPASGRSDPFPPTPLSAVAGGSLTIPERPGGAWNLLTWMKRVTSADPNMTIYTMYFFWVSHLGYT